MELIPGHIYSSVYGIYYIFVTGLDKHYIYYYYMHEPEHQITRPLYTFEVRLWKRIS